jgi:hypothetical protein
MLILCRQQNVLVKDLKKSFFTGTVHLVLFDYFMDILQDIQVSSRKFGRISGIRLLD